MTATIYMSCGSIFLVVKPLDIKILRARLIEQLDIEADDEDI